MTSRVQSKLTDLIHQLDSSTAGEAVAATRRTHATATSMEDRQRSGSLDYLRLSIKYLVFDLEATHFARTSTSQTARAEQAADAIRGQHGE